MANVTPVDFKIPTSPYWIDRGLSSAEQAIAMGELGQIQLANAFSVTSAELSKDIKTFYNKYGTIQTSPTFTTLKDGTKVISGSASKLVVKQSDAFKRMATGTRLQSLEAQLNKHILALGVNEELIMRNTLTNVAHQTYYNNLYNISTGINIGTQFDVLTVDTIKALINNPVAGANFSTRLWANTTKLATNVNRELKNGIVQGLSNGEMAKRVATDQTKKGLYNANRLIRTETTNTMNQSALESYKRSGIVERYQYLATLDRRTSEICAELDGAVFKLSEAVTGLNVPPMHVMCRSTTTAYFDSSLDYATRMARAGNGKTFYVPGNTSYADFIKLVGAKDKVNIAKQLTLPKPTKPLSKPIITPPPEPTVIE